MLVVNKKQSEYLADLLAGETADAAPVSESPAPAPAAPNRPRGMILLARESALSRVASGEVRQVTQLLLDAARVRIWPGNERIYGNPT